MNQQTYVIYVNLSYTKTLINLVISGSKESNAWI